MKTVDDRAAQELLWANGYLVQPGMGTDMLVLDSNGTKVAFASRNMADGRWTARKLGGCMSFGAPQVVDDDPHVALIRLLNVPPIPAPQEPTPEERAVADVAEDASIDREDQAADRLSELGYQIAPFERPGLPDAWALVKDGEGIAFAEPLPDGRWRAKKKGMARAMLGDANAVYDAGPMAVFCRLIGKPV